MEKRALSRHPDPNWHTGAKMLNMLGARVRFARRDGVSGKVLDKNGALIY